MNPIMLVFPAGIATSMAFHLPVGTPPNAIISGYAGIKTKYMVSFIVESGGDFVKNIPYLFYRLRLASYPRSLL